MRTKAAVLYQPGVALSIEDVELDAPGPGEALVRVDAAGVCHSDRHWMLGHVSCPLPVVLGHEGCGTVVTVGDGVAAVRPGDRCLFVLRPSCGHCRYCASGRPMLCNGYTNPDGTMLDATTRLHRLDGQPIYHFARLSCFAEHAVIPEEQLLPIARDIPPQRAALIGCAVLTGFGAVVNTAAVRPGADVAVIGCGGIGLNVISAARMVGAGRVIGIDTDQRHLAHAERFGADAVVDASDTDPVTRVRELTDGGADYAFDAYGSPRTTEQAFDMIRAGGTAVQIGLAAEDARAAISPLTLAMEEKTLKGCFMGSSRPRIDVPWLVGLYRQGRLDLAALVTRTYRLEEINTAYADLEQGRLARGVISFAA